MNRITKNEPFRPSRNRAAGGKAAEEPARDARDRARCDSVEITRDWRRQADWKALARNALDLLRREYGNVHTSISEDGLGGGSLAKLAAGLGNGVHLVISQDFLDRMGGGAEEYEACQARLEEIFHQLSMGAGGAAGVGAYLDGKSVTYWTVPQKRSNFQNMYEKKEKGGDFARVPSNDWKVSIDPSAYNTGQHYASLARANSRFEAQTVMGDVHRDLSSLRLVACLAEGEERTKAMMAIKSLQKLLLRGRRKMKRFDDEAVVERRRKRAQEERMRKEAEQLRQELRKQRAARRTEDRALANEGVAEQMALQRKRQAVEEWSTVDAAGDMTQIFAQPAVSVREAGGRFTAADVCVSAAIPF